MSLNDRVHSNTNNTVVMLLPLSVALSLIGITQNVSDALRRMFLERLGLETRKSRLDFGSDLVLDLGICFHFL